MDTKDFVVVVGRQYGSGGRKLAGELARRLGATYYDRELLSEAASRLGFAPAIFHVADERRPSLFRGSLMHALGVAGGADTLSGEGIFQAQSEVLQALATSGRHVIVGRAADYVLRSHPHMASIFLCAPIEYRARNIIERGECADQAHAMELARKADRRREDFYNYFTSRHWGHADNYHLTLDASHLSLPQQADMVEALLKARGFI